MKLNLFWDYENKMFVRSQTDATPITLPKLYQWTTPSIVMTLLAPNPTGGMNAPFTKLTDLTGLIVQIGIGNPKGTNSPAALCSLAADDTAKTMNGPLELGTTQINAMLGTELEAEAFMEVVVSKSGALDRGQAPVVLRACLIDPSGTPPTPVITDYYTATECDARFAPYEIDADHLLQHLLAGRYITYTRVNQAGQGTSYHGEKIRIDCTMPDPPSVPVLP